MATPYNRNRKVQRRIVSSSLSSNYSKFNKAQFVITAVILAIVSLSTVALSLALGWHL